MTIFEVRAATTADAAPLAAFAAHCFRDWYGPLNDPEDVELHISRTYGEAIQAAELADPACLYLLATHAEGIAGFALLSFVGGDPAVRGPRPCEVARFYVDRVWHGTGVATSLMERAVDVARGRGHGTLWLKSWEQNPRALAFYSKMGFRHVGASVFVLGNSPQSDRVLERLL
jgi:GNAT superfamily N-acetyltransferase